VSKPFRSENLVLATSTRWFGSLRVRIAAAALSVLLYAAFLLLFVPSAGIAVNYFVILPVIVCSLAFGALGGVISGSLGLFSNKLLLALRGFPEHMPANDIAAAVSGLLIGTTLGILANHYRNLGREILRRREVDERLRWALKERNLLLREIHHRVKNNLNVIHSLIGLQIGNLRDAASVDLLNDLSRRIGSMSFVHDQLNEKPYTGALRLHRYIPSLVEQILNSQTWAPVLRSFSVDESLPEIPLSRATSLGLIINEVVVNSLKHAFADTAEPKISIFAVPLGGDIVIRVVDNGCGFNPSSVQEGLGFGLIAALARQLDGEYRYTVVSGTEFTLTIPAKDPPGGSEYRFL
jgi:two-component sensor histidine kinase